MGLDTISYAFYPIVIAAMFSTVVGMANSLLAQLGDRTQPQTSARWCRSS